MAKVASKTCDTISSIGSMGGEVEKVEQQRVEDQSGEEFNSFMYWREPIENVQDINIEKPELLPVSGPAFFDYMIT